MLAIYKYITNAPSFAVFGKILEIVHQPWLYINM